MNDAQVLSDVSRMWDDHIVDEIKQYIEIPAKSPSFEKEWAKIRNLETKLGNANKYQ